MVVTAENVEREDYAFWVEKAPSDKTYRLELLEEYDGTLLSEREMFKHGFKGGKSLEVPNCNNKQLLDYIKTVF